MAAGVRRARAPPALHIPEPAPVSYVSYYYYIPNDMI